MIENGIRLFNNSGVERIVTVIGYRAEALVPVLKASSSRYVINEEYQDGMFSSILKGVVELKEECDGFFLLPVDIPYVRPTTIRKLIERFNADPSLLVCYPEFEARRGHPPLIASSLIDQIVAYSGEGGMRGFLQGYASRATSVPVADPFIRMDVDTEEDVVNLKKEISGFVPYREA